MRASVVWAGVSGFALSVSILSFFLALLTSFSLALTRADPAVAGVGSRIKKNIYIYIYNFFLLEYNLRNHFGDGLHQRHENKTDRNVKKYLPVMKGGGRSGDTPTHELVVNALLGNEE